MPFLIDVRQGVIDFPELGGQVGKVATDIGGHLLAAVHAGIFLDVGSHFFAYREVMAKKGAEELFHGSRLWGSGAPFFGAGALGFL